MTTIEIKRVGRQVVLALTAAVVGMIPAAVHSQQSERRRAKPPPFSREVREAFVEDFRKLLEGPRPEAAARSAGGNDNDSSGAGDQSVRFAWSRLIDGETITTEIKRTVNGLNDALRTPGQFRGGGHQACRRDLGLLAVLFGVAAEFDGDIRFQEDAATLRDALAATSSACEQPSDASFALVQSRKLQLDDVLRGQRLAEREAGKQFVWSDVADRDLLMQRMEMGLEERIEGALIDLRTFRLKKSELRHEAQLLALLAEIVTREQYEFWDDETYAEYADELGVAATALAAAVNRQDYESAREAAKQASANCTNCHDGYR